MLSKATARAHPLLASLGSLGNVSSGLSVVNLPRWGLDGGLSTRPPRSTRYDKSVIICTTYTRAAPVCIKRRDLGLTKRSKIFVLATRPAALRGREKRRRAPLRRPRSRAQARLRRRDDGRASLSILFACCRKNESGNGREHSFAEIFVAPAIAFLFLFFSSSRLRPRRPTIKCVSVVLVPARDSSRRRNFWHFGSRRCPCAGGTVVNIYESRGRTLFRVSLAPSRARRGKPTRVEH